jgi:hypothetical protein
MPFGIGRSTKMGSVLRLVSAPPFCRAPLEQTSSQLITAKSHLPPAVSGPHPAKKVATESDRPKQQPESKHGLAVDVDGGQCDLPPRTIPAGRFSSLQDLRRGRAGSHNDS